MPICTLTFLSSSQQLQLLCTCMLATMLPPPAGCKIVKLNSPIGTEKTDCISVNMSSSVIKEDHLIFPSRPLHASMSLVPNLGIDTFPSLSVRQNSGRFQKFEISLQIISLGFSWSLAKVQYCYSVTNGF